MSDADSDLTRPLFKHLISKNWRAYDATASHIVRVENRKTEPISGDDWAEFFLGPQLSSNVPSEVVELFEVARGVMCYGYFFYPLYTVGNEQLYRVLDAALAHRCDGLGAPNRFNTFSKRILWLSDQNVISNKRRIQWEATRQLRNSSSHAVRQSICDPTAAARSVDIAAELINELFDSENAVR